MHLAAAGSTFTTALRLGLDSEVNLEGGVLGKKMARMGDLNVQLHERF